MKFVKSFASKKVAIKHDSIRCCFYSFGDWKIELNLKLSSLIINQLLPKRHKNWKRQKWWCCLQREQKTKLHLKQASLVQKNVIRLSRRNDDGRRLWICCKQKKINTKKQPAEKKTESAKSRQPGQLIDSDFLAETEHTKLRATARTKTEGKEKCLAE